MIRAVGGKMLAATVAAVMVIAIGASAQTDIPLISKLHRRGDMHFDPATKKPYTGTVNPSDCDQCGWSGSAEIKDGKFHGKYSEMWEEGSVEGTYKDGKRDGEWKSSSFEMGDDDSFRTKVEIYKDGVLQPAGGAGK